MSIASRSVGSASVASRRAGADANPLGGGAAAVITTAPTGVDAWVMTMSPSPVIHLTTDGSTVDTTFNGTLTASIASGVGTITAGATITCVNGVGTFPGLKMVGSGTVTLRFTATGYATVDSTGIAINQMLDRTETYPSYTGLGNGTVYAGGTWGHKVFIPANYDGSAFPLMLAWHGSGSNYTPGTPVIGAQIGDGIGPTVVANKGSWPCITIFPQFKTTGTTAPAGSPVGTAIAYGGLPLWLARLATDSIAYDANRFYMYGFSEGGNIATATMVLNPGIFAAFVMPSSWANPFIMNALIAGGLPGFTNNVNSTTDHTASANAFLSAYPTIPMQQYAGSADTSPIGPIAPISTVIAASDLQSGRTDFLASGATTLWATNPNYVYTRYTATGQNTHTACESTANHLYDTPTSSGMVWLLAQHLTGGAAAVLSPRSHFFGTFSARTPSRRIA